MKNRKYLGMPLDPASQTTFIGKNAAKTFVIRAAADIATMPTVVQGRIRRNLYITWKNQVKKPVVSLKRFIVAATSRRSAVRVRQYQEACFHKVAEDFRGRHLPDCVPGQASMG
jgi:hypothetical protein